MGQSFSLVRHKEGQSFSLKIILIGPLPVNIILNGPLPGKVTIIVSYRYQSKKFSLLDHQVVELFSLKCKSFPLVREVTKL